jgi:hypothetical protein
MQKIAAVLRSEDGSVIILAILFLALTTIIAFTAMRTSTVEVQISTNELLHQKYFFTAEAGIDWAAKLLEQPFVAANASRVRSGETASWDFAFVGPDEQSNTADDVSGSEGEQGSYADGSLWIDSAVIDGIHITVTLWNNDESPATGTGADGDFDTDQDGLIWLRSDATGPRGGGSSVQILLRGNTTGESVTGYSAQAGAGAGKNYNASDLNPIRDFNRQL